MTSRFYDLMVSEIITVWKPDEMWVWQGQLAEGNTTYGRNWIPHSKAIRRIHKNTKWELDNKRKCD